MFYYPIRLYLKSLPNIILIPLSGALNIFIWIWLLLNIGPQAEPIFLHYNIIFGVDLVGEWWKVLYIPISGLFIILFNGVLGWFLYRRDKFTGVLLNVISLVSQIFLLIAAEILIFLNV